MPPAAPGAAAGEEGAMTKSSQSSSWTDRGREEERGDRDRDARDRDERDHGDKDRGCGDRRDDRDDDHHHGGHHGPSAPDCGCSPAPGGTPDNAISFLLTGDGVKLQVTVTEQSGDLVFKLDVLPGSNGTIGDLRALFFHVQDEKLLSGLGVTGGAVTDSRFQANAVDDLGNGANMGGAMRPFDAGIEFGTSGIGKDDIRSTSFTLSHATKDLTLDLLSEVDFGARLTSVGKPGGARGDSVKLTGESCEWNSVTAVDDQASTTEDGPPVTIAVLANDTDPDGDAISITGFTLPAKGTVTLSEDGTHFVFDPGADFQALGTGESEQVTFTYTITDGTVTDTATVTVTITGEDEPDILPEDDHACVIQKGPAIIIDVLANDGGLDDILSVATPTHGSLSIQTINGREVLVYTPGDLGLTPGESGTVTLGYRVKDLSAGDAEGYDDVAVEVQVVGQGAVTLGGGTEASDPVTWVSGTGAELYYRLDDGPLETFTAADVGDLQKIAALDPLRYLANGALQTELINGVPGTTSRNELAEGLGVDTPTSGYSSGPVSGNPEINAGSVNNPASSDLLGVILGDETFAAELTLTEFFSVEGRLASGGLATEAMTITLRSGGSDGIIVGTATLAADERNGGVVAVSGNIAASVDTASASGDWAATGTGSWSTANPGLAKLTIATMDCTLFDTIEISAFGYVTFQDGAWQLAEVMGSDVADAYLRAISYTPASCGCDLL
jgi:VCBS repeat-containing protein